MATSWYDIMVAAEETENDRVKQMSAAEWKQEGKKIMREWSGDLRHCLNHLTRMDTMRRNVATQTEAPRTVPEQMSSTQLDFAVWRDMVESPGKYGKDIVEWLEINDRLMSSPSAWRVAAFWTQLEDRLQEEQQQAAVMKIQALVRGHLVRSRAQFRDCCMCLKHCVSPVKTDIGMVCRQCAVEDQHDWLDMEPVPQCHWCLAPLDEGQEMFCDGDCANEYRQDLYIDRE